MHMAISSDVIRGYNDTMILYLLLDQPSYGYEISRQIKTLSHEKYIIKETTLYSAFTRMEKNGYITSFQDQNTATGKRRTYYRITGKGRAYYQEKCEEWLLTQEVVEQFIRKGETENGRMDYSVDRRMGNDRNFSADGGRKCIPTNSIRDRLNLCRFSDHLL